MTRAGVPSERGPRRSSRDRDCGDVRPGAVAAVAAACGARALDDVALGGGAAEPQHQHRDSQPRQDPDEDVDGHDHLVDDGAEEH